MTINEFAAEVHKNAVDHGWWEGERTFPEIVALIHSEVSEALENTATGNRFFISPATLAAFVAKRTEARIAEAALTIRKIRTPVVRAEQKARRDRGGACRRDYSRS